jgi:UDP-N-acetylmuramate dehydrogenase
MVILKNHPLQNLNTFGIQASANYFAEANSLDELIELLALKDYPQKFILGGGSNMLLTQDINALVIHVNLKGKSIIKEEEGFVEIEVMAGENWHNLVLWTLERDYGGLENLSLIPGNTGTAPIQNIGAYGVELKDSFVSCEAMDRNNQKLVTFSKADCQFGYRDSIFKNEAKDQFVITSVRFRLTKKDHTKHTAYGAIEEELQKKGITEPSIRDISKAVIAIRSAKLPNPSELGNSGSFFKNPIISASFFQEFRAKHPMAPYYEITDGTFKIPAGWLIEQCGFKGKRFGDAGIHKRQALVLVNYGNATGKEILELAQSIMAAVKEKFNIEIIPEVNIIK